MMNVLLMPVGLPRSGKSTWSRATGYPIVNPDSIRLTIHGQAFYAPAEPLVWSTAHLMVESLFRAGHPVVVLDATNISRRRRDEWVNKLWSRGFVLFQTDKEECIRRALANDQPDLVPVIERMAKTLEWPDANETRMQEPELRTFGLGRSLHYVPAAR